MHDDRAAPGATRRARGEHEAMLERYSELQDASASRDGYSIDLQGRRRCCAAWASRRRDSTSRPRRSPAAGRCASRWPSCCSAGPTCCCSTSRRTISISTRATGSRSTSTTYPHAVILVSHDRYFLDAVVTRIAGSRPADAHRLPRQLLASTSSSATRGIERLRKAKQRAGRGSRARQDVHRPLPLSGDEGAQVQSRIKMLDKVVPIEVPPERKRIHFTFPACAKSGRTVLELKHVRKAYGDHRRLRRSRPAHRARRSHRARRARTAPASPR